ncbi:uncharacterized protein PGTG_14159 [Puccinia graminis f. sp. tritici CRL 75-36-700-3]|uniref:Uncharacterized protein n=1 Tax=Puccinia graminis f. sp. tritici (strain CRL 75-36-700-3 / race SCCL) TaxID=418459 RepID=E3KX50_PUCGT|nr:uncharacterized protein PGTG_14159 [Puccinia graminis f. sp. tritici CRL 75-36-700-3]EFP88820.2 hypothetical protein PGTG_14159 [Puccinia graminis f. sp. tritici CRL 75-36-700-3]
MVSGRILAPNSKTTPVFHYEGETIVDLGDSENFKADLTGKSSVLGFGVVAKGQVQFRAQYIISGRKNLANTFGLFQIGREVLISGHITGYDQDEYMWIVNALSVSIASGHQSGISQSSSSNAKAATMRRRPGLISLEDDNDPVGVNTGSAHNMPKANSISGEGANGSGPLPEPVTDPGAVLSPGSYYKSLASTPSRKRTKKEILADAKRAKAALA